MFKHSDIQYTSLTPDIILNSLVYRTLFYINIYGSFKLSKNSPVFWPTLYIQFHVCYCLTASLISNKQQIAPCPGTVVVAIVVIVEVLIVGLDTSVVVVGVVVHVPTFIS